MVQDLDHKAEKVRFECLRRPRQLVSRSDITHLQTYNQDHSLSRGWTVADQTKSTYFIFQKKKRFLFRWWVKKIFSVQKNGFLLKLLEIFALRGSNAAIYEIIGIITKIVEKFWIYTLKNRIFSRSRPPCNAKLSNNWTRHRGEKSFYRVLFKKLNTSIFTMCNFSTLPASR